MKCQSIAKKTKKQCEKNALNGTSYCWNHTSKREPLIFLIIGVLLGFTLEIVYENFVNSPEKKEILKLQTKIDKLETTLDPFKKEAERRFPNEAIDEALIKLENDLSEVKEQAAPNTLRPNKNEIIKISNGYQLFYQFATSKNEPLGQLRFEVSILNGSDAKISKITPSLKGGAFFHSDNPGIISNDMKKATLSYTPASAGYPVIEIIVSKKCILEIKGNHGLKPFKVKVPN